MADIVKSRPEKIPLKIKIRSGKIVALALELQKPRDALLDIKMIAFFVRSTSQVKIEYPFELEQFKTD